VGPRGDAPVESLGELAGGRRLAGGFLRRSRLSDVRLFARATSGHRAECGSCGKFRKLTTRDGWRHSDAPLPTKQTRRERRHCRNSPDRPQTCRSRRDGALQLTCRHTSVLVIWITSPEWRLSEACVGRLFAKVSFHVDLPLELALGVLEKQVRS